MTPRPLFEGELVRLTAIQPEADAEAIARWSLDSEYDRLGDSGSVRPLRAKFIREDIEKAEIRNDVYGFSIHILSDDRLIGFIFLDGIEWSHGTGWVGIGIGERDCWGKGYGTDAMRVLLRFAFEELNLYRVNLDVFEYNPRAIRSYEKVGFVHEGRQRGLLHRDKRRWDLIFMGILREEWENAQL